LSKSAEKVDQQITVRII